MCKRLPGGQLLSAPLEKGTVLNPTGFEFQKATRVISMISPELLGKVVLKAIEPKACSQHLRSSRVEEVTENVNTMTYT